MQIADSEQDSGNLQLYFLNQWAYLGSYEAPSDFLVEIRIEIFGVFAFLAASGRNRI